MIPFLIIESLIVSTLIYYYLHRKTRINLKFLYLDNLVVAGVAVGLLWLLSTLLTGNHWILYVICPPLLLGLAFGLTMIRFWRTPKRKIKASANEIVSPADGNVIYIKQVKASEVPISVKGKTISKLTELTKTNILDKPSWLIGINMTPFDVHKNCAPIDGKILLNQHFSGKFLSLKEHTALTENERHTYVIENSAIMVGIVQIASKLVRRIDSYVKSGANVHKGDWLGMIRFGSQVDVILPLECEIHVELGQQLYAGTSIIADLADKDSHEGT